ncbi:hypothetical protein AB0M46_13745 [Dactylosporangium sp. NPDC051485]|uniref:hypothetical protein n=1 Tax=Dactylosporangium sp. NPDC051485 TaxID=3154846 RepID=UPI003434BA4A
MEDADAEPVMIYPVDDEVQRLIPINFGAFFAANRGRTSNIEDGGDVAHVADREAGQRFGE